MANAFEEDAETETDHESDLRLLRSAREHAALARHAAERAAQAGDNCAQAIGQLLGELQEHKVEDETAHGEISAHLNQVEHLAVHTNKTVTAISEKLRIAIAPLGTPGAFRPISEMESRKLSREPRGHQDRIEGHEAERCRDREGDQDRREHLDRRTLDRARSARTLPLDPLGNGDRGWSKDRGEREREMALALALAYRNLTGKAPDPNTLGMMAAQSYLESGHGQSMYNWNFGGIKGDGAPGTAGVVVLPTHEVVDGEDKIYHLRFRAYLSMLDGATDHVRLLLRYYPSALACAAQGDCQGYAEALKSHGYFTAPVETGQTRTGNFTPGTPP